MSAVIHRPSFEHWSRSTRPSCECGWIGIPMTRRRAERQYHDHVEAETHHDMEFGTPVAAATGGAAVMATVPTSSIRPTNRYVRLRCPVCIDVSPVCDQQEDIRRTTLENWWAEHLRRHVPWPTFEACEGPEV